MKNFKILFLFLILSLLLNLNFKTLSCYDFQNNDFDNSLMYPINNKLNSSVMDIKIIENEIYFATWGDGIFKSFDDGENLIPLNNGLITHFINKILFNPEDPNTIYLGSDIGIYKSNNKGKKWEILSYLPDTVNSIIFNITNHNMLYAGCNSYGFYISNDRGKTWKYVDIDNSLNIKEEMIYYVEQNINKPNELYLATIVGLYRSLDYGNNWEKIAFDKTKVYCVEIEYLENQKKIYVGTEFGLFVSHDNGKNWEGIFKTLKSGVKSINFYRGDENIVIFLTIDGEIYKYYENYKKLEKIDIGNNKVNCIFIDSKRKKLFICSTNKILISNIFDEKFIEFEEPTSVNCTKKIENFEFSCTDNGLFLKYNKSKWKKIALHGFRVNYIEFDPENINIFFVATNKGLYKTENFGESFDIVKIDDILSLNVNKVKIIKKDGISLIFVSSNYGFYKSNYDNNLKFKKTYSKYVNCFDINGSDPSIIFLGSQGVYKSIDYGENWNLVSLSYYSITAIKIDNNNPNIIYAGTSNYGLFRTFDNGKNWEKAFNFDSEFYTFRNIFIHPKNSNIIYTFGRFAMPVPGGVIGFCFYTDNNFKTWSLLHPQRTIKDIRYSYYVNDEQLILSTDLGNFYFNLVLNSGYFKSKYTSNYISNLLKYDNKFYYIGKDGKIGFYDKSEDLWKYTYELDIAIFSCAQDPRNPRNIYLGSHFGLYKFDLKLLKYLEDSIDTNFTFSLNSIYIEEDDTLKVYLLTNYGIYFSENFEYNWKFLGLKDIKVYSIESVKLNDKKYYFASTNLGLYQSENLKDWKRVFYLKDYIDVPYIGTQIFISKYLFDKLYVGTENGIYISEDFGKTWKFLGLERARIFVIDDYKSKGFITTGDSGIYYFDYNKRIFYPLNNGLSEYYINDLLIDEKNNIYIGTDGCGIFKLIKNIPIKLNINFSFIDIYPKITWYSTELESHDIIGFELYRGESLEKIELLKKFDSNVYEFIDNEVEERKTYYYYLVAIDIFYNKSDPSNIIEINIPIRDKNPPILEILYPGDDEIINCKQIKLIGKSYDLESKIKQILINESSIDFLETGEFEYTIFLNEGENLITIKSIDLYENFNIKQLKIYVDTIIPEVKVSLPNKTYSNNLILNGEIIENSKIKYLKINNINVDLKDEMKFSYSLNLKEGENIIVIDCEDLAGNKFYKEYKINYIKLTIIELEIGSDTIYINNLPQKIDVTPIIIEGRTYLPIRYILEPLGATFSWDSIEKKVSIIFKEIFIELWIGKNLAKVNNNNKEIDPNNPKVTPLILNGRTMLPIRFIAENLGCKVEWDSLSKRIKIIYPNIDL